MKQIFNLRAFARVLFTDLPRYGAVQASGRRQVRRAGVPAHRRNDLPAAHAATAALRACVM